MPESRPTPLVESSASPSHQRSGPRRSRLGAALLLAALVLTACGGGDEPADGISSEGSKNPKVEAVTSPLTGLELDKVPTQPVLTLKMDNSEASAPQIGLGQADLVIEELVEGGITRLAASYFSTIPKNAGPVRSMRASDIGIVLPLGATLVTSGGAKETIGRMKENKIDFRNEETTGFSRDTSRQIPYNLFVNMKKLLSTVPDGSPVDPFLPFGAANLPKGKPATDFTVTYSPRSSSSFQFADGVYNNTDTNAGDGEGFVADTVLMLDVEIVDAGYTDPSGAFVPETVFTGEGAARIFSQGRVVKGKWLKPGLDQTLTLQVKGKDVQVAPGKVWIGLLPTPQDGGRISINVR